MDQLIGVVNELHDSFANVKMNIKLNLPQIAVVGCQSSGKSSVLESFVGKDFLPRGSGIVTRCPLVLQLVQLPKNKEEEWGEFLHCPDKKFFDFREINDEIQSRTETVAGLTGITDRPINLKIYSRHVLNLTLVDLPGLVMNAVGDQPKDIDRQIKDMVTRYVSPANTIILAISPANTDLATSASLRLAKQLDPDGLRTIGVLTKLDLMDRGTNAFDILTGKLMHLRHGFVGVVNRSQQDINDFKGMEAARKDEYSFFRTHPAYSSIAERQGSEYLAKKLNNLLLEHIKAVIPDLKHHVDKLLTSTRKEMEKLGMLGQEKIDLSDNMLHLIKLFCDSLNQMIAGGLTDARKEVLGGARLDYIFHECFASYVSNLTASKDLTDDYIRVNTRNMAGMHATLFPSDKVFFSLSKKQIERLEEPSLKCVTFVYEELLKIVDTCATVVDRFPKLKEEIIKVCQGLLQGYRIPTMKHIQTVIAAERGFINVKHPLMEELTQNALAKVLSPPEEANGKSDKQSDGKDGKGKLGKTGLKGASGADGLGDHGERGGNMGSIPSNIVLAGNMTAHERQINNVIRDVVEGYFTIVKGTISDQVPKAITLLMIQRLCEEAYAKLVSKLYPPSPSSDLLAEPPETAMRRQATTTMMEALTKAQNALDSVRDYII